MIKHKSTILNQLFYSEMKALVDKFNKIKENEILEIEEILRPIKDEDIKSYLINKPKKLSEIIKENKKMKLKRGEIELFGFVNSEIEEVDISKAKEYYEELLAIDYVEIGEYIIYKTGICLKEYAYSVFENRLSDEFWVEKMFSKDDVINMWVNEITKEQALEEILDNTDLEEALELYPQYALSINGIDYKYSQVEE
ncbi:hypothetical protein [Terrisporobacter muris]|uniref:Uncharacterized protein n=1 Tax=Terrisporobacter muris TaxID=2963284 RepID=A0A9X2S0K7_9FIRM|nr:hypothetical protein [Terrisporobacter muris]MCR1822103.1 hypothetical protein [Terrisporobacter muris]